MGFDARGALRARPLELVVPVIAHQAAELVLADAVPAEDLAARVDAAVGDLLAAPPCRSR